ASDEQATRFLMLRERVSEVVAEVRRSVVTLRTTVGESESLAAADFPQIAALIAASPESPEATTSAVPDPEPGQTPVSNGAAQASVPGPAANGHAAPADFALRDQNGEVRRVEEVEADLIRLAHAQYHGRMSEIARRLGIGRSTLYRKMREYKIDAD
ncbi:MAG: helix-turn-helix domain-containing protein, partial [Aurantimonas coralicida]|nr:helix-turn-helix domain-containing protein [Aurantimonas coralicida]